MPKQKGPRELLEYRMLPQEAFLLKHATCACTAVRFRDSGKITLARLAAHDARNNFAKWRFVSERDSLWNKFIDDLRKSDEMLQAYEKLQET